MAMRIMGSRDRHVCKLDSRSVAKIREKGIQFRLDMYHALMTNVLGSRVPGLDIRANFSGRISGRTMQGWIFTGPWELSCQLVP